MKRYLIVVTVALIVLLVALAIIKPSINKSIEKITTIQDERVALIDSILD